MTVGYAFRDTEVAAARLELVAELFEPTSCAFLAEHGLRHAELAVDLGCGPGHTTRLLAEVLAPRRLVGLDASRRFLELAATDGIETAEHDVTATPFPTGPVDLAYCRFLLSHVAGPERVVAAWATQLRTAGRLLLEEVEWIHTDDPVFARYLELVRKMLANRGQRLEVGPALANLEPDGLRRRVGRIATVAPDPARVAWMFLLNLRAWRDDPLLDPDVVAEVEAGLAAEQPHPLRRRHLHSWAAPSSLRRRPIVWGLRQIAYEEAR